MASNNQIVSGTQFPFQSQNCSVAMIFFLISTNRKKTEKVKIIPPKKNHLKPLKPASTCIFFSE